MNGAVDMLLLLGRSSLCVLARVDGAVVAAEDEGDAAVVAAAWIDFSKIAKACKPLNRENCKIAKILFGPLKAPA